MSTIDVSSQKSVQVPETGALDFKQSWAGDAFSKPSWCSAVSCMKDMRGVVRGG